MAMLNNQRVYDLYGYCLLYGIPIAILELSAGCIGP